MQIENIEDLLPQRPPFIMVDQLDYADNVKAGSSFTITKNNILVENDYFTEAGIIENIAQSAALHAGYLALKVRETVPKGIIGGIKNLRINFLPKVKDKINTIVSIEHEIINAKIIKGTAYRKQEIIAECEMTVFLT